MSLVAALGNVLEQSELTHITDLWEGGGDDDGEGWLKAVHPTHWWEVAHIDTLGHNSVSVDWGIGRRRFVNDSVPVLELPDYLIAGMKKNCTASAAAAKAKPKPAGGKPRAAVALRGHAFRSGFTFQKSTCATDTLQVQRSIADSVKKHLVGDLMSQGYEVDIFIMTFPCSAATNSAYLDAYKEWYAPKGFFLIDEESDPVLKSLVKKDMIETKQGSLLMFARATVPACVPFYRHSSSVVRCCCQGGWLKGPCV
jgi:hypothetical protein